MLDFYERRSSVNVSSTLQVVKDETLKALIYFCIYRICNIYKHTLQMDIWLGKVYKG